MPRRNRRSPVVLQPINFGEFVVSPRIPGESGKKRAADYARYVGEKLAGMAGERAPVLTLKELNEARKKLRGHYAAGRADAEEKE